MDGEKIILALKHCVEDNCIGCPYQNTVSGKCLNNLKNDVLKYIEKINHKKKVGEIYEKD